MRIYINISNYMTIGLTQYQLLLLQCERVCFVRCMLFINDDINGISFLYMYIYCVRKLRRTCIHVHSTSINIQHVHGSCKCVSSFFCFHMRRVPVMDFIPLLMGTCLIFSVTNDNLVHASAQCLYR